MIVVQSHCDTVAGAGAAGCSRVVVQVEETVWVLYVDAIDSVLPDVRLGVCGHESDNGVEVGVEVGGGTTMAMAMVLVSSFKRFRDVGVSVVGTVLAGSVIT